MAEDASSSLVLASQSAARARLLQAAGLAIRVAPAALDEAEVKASFRAEGGASASASACAAALAAAKARLVSRRWPGALVIGADQMLVCDGVWFDKPADRGAAAAQLRALAGRTHTLETAVAVARDEAVLWSHSEPAHLAMRPLQDAEISAYLDAAGEAALGSVGAYQLEGIGVRLFERVEGDHFTVLGLPLLPLLAFLRPHGVGRF